MKHVRHAIVGLGIAGATLAWRLKLRGESVAIIDDPQPNSSSRIAAGLITPFTGQRFAPTPRWDEFWPAAESFYRQIEDLTQKSFFHVAPAVRLFNQQEFAHIASMRLAQHPDLLRRIDPPAGFGQPGDVSVEMGTAGRVDVLAYLAATQEYFADQGDYYEAKIEADDGVPLAALNLKCDRLIFCTGCYAPPAEFASLPFQPAKGELLTVEMPGVELSQVVHREVWVSPRGANRYQVGATFDRDKLDLMPTTVARDELLTKLAEITTQQAYVVQQTVGLRPIVRGRRPVVIPSHDNDQTWIFTGLGSKGCLLAPLLAESFAGHLIDGEMLDCEICTDPNATRRLIDQAHAEVSAVVKPGDIVIDATVGGGRDTVFLARLVGSGGEVYGFDVQHRAHFETSARLGQVYAENVTIYVMDHARMLEVLPKKIYGKVAAIMFNLGYLPGGDQQITTSTRSTLNALSAAVRLLRPDGILTVLAYRGHPGGVEETAAAYKFLRMCAEPKSPQVIQGSAFDSPVLMILRRKR